jgi:aminopeptidase
MDQRYEALAQILVQQCIAVKPGDKVWVTVQDTIGLPAAEAVVSQIIAAGGYPHIELGSERLREHVLERATLEQLVGNIDLFAFQTQHFDKRIVLEVEVNQASLARVDKKKLQDRDRALRPFSKLLLEKPWVYTCLPSPSLAQSARMSTAQLEDFYFNATVQDWPKEAVRMKHMAEQLENAQLHIVGEETDLHLSSQGRIWVWDDWKANMPGGEVFTAPVDNSVEGHVYFSFPLTRNGVVMRDIRLWFEKGVVVKATASEGQEYLEQLLDTDAGARRLGEFAIGGNKGVTSYMNNVLFDEKMYGTLHMALGHAYTDCGGVNSSALHMDIVKDMRLAGSEIRADEKVVLKDGEWVG